MIRPGLASDNEWIRELARSVYRDLGDYGQIIASWIEHRGTSSYVEVDAAGRRRGFVLIGLLDASTREANTVADLLAIAVEPSDQRSGIGRRLLAFAIRLARSLTVAGRAVSELQLTVAEDNFAGRQLYASTGFEVVDPFHGAYEGGQRAIRMSLLLS